MFIRAFLGATGLPVGFFYRCVEALYIYCVV